MNDIYFAEVAGAIFGTRLSPGVGGVGLDSVDDEEVVGGLLVVTVTAWRILPNQHRRDQQYQEICPDVARRSQLSIHNSILPDEWYCLQLFSLLKAPAGYALRPGRAREVPDCGMSA